MYMSPQRGRVYGSRWRGMEGNMEIQFPFLSVCCHYSIYTRTFPRSRGHCSEAHVSSPPYRRSRFPVGVCGCLLMSVSGGPRLHLPPFQAGDWERVCRSFSFWSLCLCPQGSLESLYLSLHSVEKGSDTDTVHMFVIIQVGDRHLNIKRPETFLVPLLVFLLLLLSSCFISQSI